jgi:hypothetical protein
MNPAVVKILRQRKTSDALMTICACVFFCGFILGIVVALLTSHILLGCLISVGCPIASMLAAIVICRWAASNEHRFEKSIAGDQH